jgi:hypothetical protein
MSIKRRELFILVSTFNIVGINSIYVVINIIDFKESIKALISKPLYLMNKKVSYKWDLVIKWISIALKAYKNQDYNIDLNLLNISRFLSLFNLMLFKMIL